MTQERLVDLVNMLLGLVADVIDDEPFLERRIRDLGFSDTEMRELGFDIDE